MDVSTAVTASQATARGTSRSARLLMVLLVASTGLVSQLADSTVARADDGVVAEWSGSTLLGVAKNDWHSWGQCRVRDMNGGAWGWYLRASAGVTSKTFRVHHGMLAGYTATGGPAGVGCPTSEEYAWKGGVRQDFTKGFLYWMSGMGKAIAATNGSPAGYALSRLGQTSTSETNNGKWSGWCLRFAYRAHGRQWSTTDRAIWEWNAAVKAGKAHANDTNPPVGAIVYYSWADFGHAGISVGDGWVVSTQGTSTQNLPVRIHTLKGIGLTYLGWSWPL